MRRINPTIIYAVAGVLALLLLLYVFAGGSRENPEQLSDQEIAGTSVDEPENRCGTQASYDLIKGELFRRAAQLRGGDPAALNQLAGYSVLRVDSPTLRSRDEDAATVSCSGAATLELPPGVAVVGGRRSLAAEIGYAFQGGAEGAGQMMTLTNADAIIVPLATVARVGGATGQAPAPGATLEQETAPPSPPAAPASPPREADPPRPPAAPSPPPRRADPPPPPQASASPSFNCRNAGTRGEIAVCNSAGLAQLDRQMASQFYRARSQATAPQRALLDRTRGRFLRFRDSCRSDGCVAGAYRDRMREISDIMANRWNP